MTAGSRDTATARTESAPTAAVVPSGHWPTTDLQRPRPAADDTTNPAEGAVADRARLVDAIMAAGAFYCAQLRDPAGDGAARYLIRRGLGHVLSGQTVWGVGYAPKDSPRVRCSRRGWRG